MRNILYPAKDTLHQIDLHLILTLGPRNGFGYYVELLWHKVQGDRNNSHCNNNNNNNNNNSNNNNDNNNFIILKIMIMMVIMIMMIILNNTE